MSHESGLAGVGGWRGSMCVHPRLASAGGFCT